MPLQEFHPPSLDYRLDADGFYRIDEFDLGSPFSSFLPGVAGPEGVPLWAMYVNRGQGIVSFGVEGKNRAILEFLPATWAYQLVGIQGFRTFCRIDGAFHEPFQNRIEPAREGLHRHMRIAMDCLQIEEFDEVRGLGCSVQYRTTVHQPFAALIRKMELSNESSQAMFIELLDGLPIVIPAGFDDDAMKKRRHLSEAYSGARLIDGTAAFYSTRVTTHDEPEVLEVRQGNFYAASYVRDGSLVPTVPIVDPDIVFGYGRDLTLPREFIRQAQLDVDNQVWENRLPCAFAPLSFTLEPGQSLTLYALIGHADDASAVGRALETFSYPEAFEANGEASRQLFETLTSPAFTISNHVELNAYCRQNFLDNLLRGGVPRVFPSRQGSTPVHLYTRRHGDLERDYNDFIVPPMPFSQGEGNFRDILQNRRYNVWFYPELFDEEIRMFAALFQADGYNPLSVQGYVWTCPDDLDPSTICPEGVSDAARQAFVRLVRRSFVPGELLVWADEHTVELSNRIKWIEKVLSHCDRRLQASGHEGGFWIDHWIYLADMLEAFAGVYPDRVEAMLTHAADIGWFDDGCYVLPRYEKYRRRPSGPLQIDCVADRKSRQSGMPAVTLFGKLAALLAVKAATLDCDGRGLEMEAGRPGWNDSLNGLPGQFGSSTCGTAAMTRLAHWLLDRLETVPDTLFPAVVADFIENVADEVARDAYDWDRCCTLRENFRLALVDSPDLQGSRWISGTTLRGLLENIEKRGRDGIERSIDPQTGLLTTYFRGIPEQVQPREGDRVSIGRLRYEPLPLFLEGQVHYLRLKPGTETARSVYRTVRSSGLFDEDLAMYKINEPLSDCPDSIGRARLFSRGWFENESVWLHMSYKYLLELLRNGLHEEFHRDLETMLTPFMDAKVYGRSVLENSSFIASSACPDPNVRGKGFIARLSGSTAEFIHMWAGLTAGFEPFRTTGKGLALDLRPVLPGAWFLDAPRTIAWRGEEIALPAGALACAFLGETLLVYRNEQRRDTFGENAARPSRISLDGSEPQPPASLKPEIVERIRQRQFSRIDVWLQ